MKNVPESIFDNMSLGDLGTSDTPYGVDEVGYMLQQSCYPAPNPCIYCGNSSEYRIIPKKRKFLSAYIEDKGCICTNCLKQSKLDSKLYGIRKL